jgi:glycosyltransferase involved in cell wall biosynthesis
MRVAIVAGIVVAHDAISAAVVGQAQIAATIPGVESVTIFAQYIDRALPCEGRVLTDPWSLTRDPVFVDADLVIFHWGIHYQLFDVVTLLRAEARRCVVHFHNCTPRDLVAPGDRELIDKSIAHLQHAIGLGIPFWTFSKFNERTLAEWGVEPARIAFVPFPIDLPSFEDAARKPGVVVEILSVGRRVPAKGTDVLIRAVAQLNDSARASIHVRIAGSQSFSDLGYRETLTDLIEDNHLHEVVEFVDSPTEEELWDLYRTSDIVVSCSFHEGLCVPIIEAYAFGCRAIGTTAGNLEFIVQDPDPRVAPGDPAALAQAIQTLVGEVLVNPFRKRSHTELVDRYSGAASRIALQREVYRMAASQR